MSAPLGDNREGGGPGSGVTSSTHVVLHEPSDSQRMPCSSTVVVRSERGAHHGIPPADGSGDTKAETLAGSLRTRIRAADASRWDIGVVGVLALGLAITWLGGVLLSQQESNDARYRIATDTNRTLGTVQSQMGLLFDDAFDVGLHVTVAGGSNADHFAEFVSRSEAKRLVRGLEKVREVVLDFQGVRLVGQGFADEVFRVWSSAHPEVRLIPVGMGEAVGFMVERARRAGNTAS